MATIRDSDRSVEEIDYSKYNIGNLWAQEAITPKQSNPNLRPIVDVASILGAGASSVFDIANVIDTSGGGAVGGDTGPAADNANGIGGINGTAGVTGNNMGNIAGQIGIGVAAAMLGAPPGLTTLSSKLGLTEMALDAIGLPSNNTIANRADETNTPVGLQAVSVAMKGMDDQAVENDRNRETTPTEEAGVTSVSPADVAAALGVSIATEDSITSMVEAMTAPTDDPADVAAAAASGDGASGGQTSGDLGDNAAAMGQMDAQAAENDGDTSGGTGTGPGANGGEDGGASDGNAW